MAAQVRRQGEREDLKMKKIISLILLTALCSAVIVGCSSKEEEGKVFDTSKEVSVISREDGSGTRGAFIELFGVEEKDADGNKIDNTTVEASTTNSTSVMMTTVAGNAYSIGYISLGSLNDTVKAVKIDGAEASAANIKNGTYKVSRPFYIATKGDLDVLTTDFIAFIMSNEGQKVVEDAGYIPIEASGAYSGSKPEGKLTIAGSSSVAPVMEKLKEAYLVLNSSASIEIQQNDSTSGMNSVNDGICNIGMASREIKESELANGLNGTVIAVDGIAVIVNKDNTVNDLTSEQVKAIYIGESTLWSDIVK